MSSDPASPSRPIRPIGRLGGRVTIALGLWCVCDAMVLGTWAWLVLMYGEEMGRPASSSVAEIDFWSGLNGLAFYGALVAMLVAAVLFTAWLSRARDNAEAISPLPHVRGRAWIVLGWIVPVVNLWFPYQVVQSIWRTSDPSRVAGGPTNVPTSPLVVGWWVSYLVFTTGSFLGMTSLANTSPSDPSSSDGGIVLVGAAVAGLVAAVLAAAVVRDISTTQDRIATTVSTH